MTARTKLEFDLLWIGAVSTAVTRELRKHFREASESGPVRLNCRPVVTAAAPSDVAGLLREHRNVQAVVLAAKADNAAIATAHELRGLRPELELYLFTDSPFGEVDDEVHTAFDRIAFAVEPLRDLCQAVLHGVASRYRTPFFDALTSFGNRPVEVFHALPIGRGNSVLGSRWISDFGDYFGANTLLAEASATNGGLDSLFAPTGPLKVAQALAATAYGADRTFFVTNGTSTANKIVLQALVRPGDLVLINRDCHHSHHYGLLQSGATPIYLPSWQLAQYAMSGAVRVRSILDELEKVRAAGYLDRVRMLVLTNCTFDGLTYDVEAVMDSVLAIKPEMIFLWDEAWFAHARFSPRLRARTAMHAARRLAAKYQSHDRIRVRVYATQSTHKTLTSFRQGSMIHVLDEAFETEVAGPFREAYLAHTSTSPNYSILASLDAGRRQVQLEGYAMVEDGLDRAEELRAALAGRPQLRKYFDVLEAADLIPADEPCTLDPTKITLGVGRTGMSGQDFRNLLMDGYQIQVNKTSLNTVLLMTNIGTRSNSQAKLLGALLDIADQLDRGLLGGGASAAPVPPPPMPDFSRFHARFRPLPGLAAGDVRAAFYLAYTAENCTHVTLRQAIDRAVAGEDLVSAAFVTPYPPGFPVLVPGQVLSAEIAGYLSALAPADILGCDSGHYLRVFRPEALATADVNGGVGR